MKITEGQRKEMRDLATKLVNQLPAKSPERAWAVLIANGTMPPNEVLIHMRRICRHVGKTKSARYSMPLKAEVWEWLSRYGSRLAKEEVRGARRLEMRLSVEEYDEIKQRAERAGLSMAGYARWLVLGGA